MPLFDTVLLNEDIVVPDFAESPTYDIKDSYRLWQTKGLNPSLDVYLVTDPNLIFEDCPVESGTQMLFRRHPPLQKWTIENHGALRDISNEDILCDADHWRLTKFSGVLTITDVLLSNHTVYEYDLSFDNGILQNIELQSIDTFDFKSRDTLINEES